LSDSGDDLHTAAHDVCSLLHAHEAEPTTVVPHGLDIESPAVVGDCHLDMLAKSCQRHVESFRFAVHDPVSERLLSDSEETDGNIRMQAPAAEALKPDLIVLDISMPLLNGLEAGRQIKHKLGNIKLVFLTMNEDPSLAAEAFRAGASAYVLKRSVASELTTAIREVMQGRSYITPLVADGLVESLQHVDQRAPGHELTPRQREVLQLLAEGNR
jgi:CheY-like chemotaxis protein